MRVVPPVGGAAAGPVRLCRPSGPWLHLLDAAPADARQLGWLLDRDGVVTRMLRGACARSTYGFLDELGAALQLPGDPVEDWPELTALLTDMAWLPGRGHVLVVTRAALLLAAAPPAELRRLLEVVREVARARAAEDAPVPFHVVLQDDSVGLAALRARLDAVGARYAPLAGWEASEPAACAVAPARSVLSAGGPVDAADRAAGAAVAHLGGVPSLGRALEELRGGCSGPVRVYVPILCEAMDAVAVAGAVAGAVAVAGESCIVVPMPTDLALADVRQAALAAAATEVWPSVPTAYATPAGTAAPGSGPSARPASRDQPASPAEPATGPAASRPAAPAQAVAPADAADRPGSLHPDATFRPGPATDDLEHGALLSELAAWADRQPGVIGLVTAWTGADRLVIGVALSPGADPDRIRAEAPAPVEPFDPSRGLDPVHRRLTRAATRLWIRRAERGVPAGSATAALLVPAVPAVADLGPVPVRDTADARGDEELDGFTLIGIDRRTPVSTGPAEPDQHDAALADWARTRAGAIALLRAVTDEQVKVYCLAVAETIDPETARRDLARAAAAAGLGRAAVEAFSPALSISAFHLDLAVGSTRLWPVRA